MKIFIDSDQNVGSVAEYLRFNDIKHEQINLFDPTVDGGRRIIPADIANTSNSLFVLETLTLKYILDYPLALQSLLEYCKNNYVWVWSDIDGFDVMMTMTNLSTVDAQIPAGSMSFFFDAEPVSTHWVAALKNIKTHIIPVSFSFRNEYFYRPSMGTVSKTKVEKDFLMFCRPKKRRPHRPILSKCLRKKPGLVDQGLVFDWKPLPHEKNFGKNLAENFYRKVWMEVVPETYYKNGYYVTEKTAKPMANRTPFLILSNALYLQHLREQGFQTFGSLIDESYDLEYRVEDRARMIVDQLEDIVRNGAESFYHACQPILDHNFRRFAEFAGGWRLINEEFIYENLRKIGAIDQ